MIKINTVFEKEIISIVDGARLGDINDIEIDETTGEIVSLIVTGKWRLFRLLGRRESYIIPWKNVRVIGEETILVDNGLNQNEITEKGSLINKFLN